MEIFSEETEPIPFKRKRRRVKPESERKKKGPRRKHIYLNGRISIGTEIHRWRQIRGSLNLRRDDDVARLLIDSFLEIKVKEYMSQCMEGDDKDVGTARLQLFQSLSLPTPAENTELEVKTVLGESDTLADRFKQSENEEISIKTEQPSPSSHWSTEDYHSSNHYQTGNEVDSNITVKVERLDSESLENYMQYGERNYPKADDIGVSTDIEPSDEKIQEKLVENRDDWRRNDPKSCGGIDASPGTKPSDELVEYKHIGNKKFRRRRNHIKSGRIDGPSDELIEEKPVVNKEGSRKSNRLSSRRAIPNYASMVLESETDTADESSDCDAFYSDYEEYVHVKIEDMNGGQSDIESNHSLASRENSLKDKTGNGKKNGTKVKRKEKDPDFVVDDDGDDRGSDVSDKETSNKRKNVRNHAKKALDHFLKRKTEKEIVKRGTKRRKKKDVSIEGSEESEDAEESVEKPWIHIKLEDFKDKYILEKVKSYERKNRNSDVTTDYFSCLICNCFKSHLRSAFEEHIEKHVNNRLNCDQCEFIGSSEFALRQHRLEYGHRPKHKRNKEFMCHICGLILNSLYTKKSHLALKHNDPQYKCEFCAEKFASSFTRRRHQTEVHPDKKRFCYKCRKDFEAMSVEEFKEHVQHCKPSYQCQTCGVVFRQRCSLTSHIKVKHKKIREYQCSLCPYASSTPATLRFHMLTHANEHPISCDYCSFTCVRKTQLKSHMRTHIRDKPFKCTKCKFSAAWNVQLKQHMTVHDLEDTVSCQRCEIVFKNEKAIRLHEKKEH